MDSARGCLRSLPLESRSGMTWRSSCRARSVVTQSSACLSYFDWPLMRLRGRAWRWLPGQCRLRAFCGQVRCWNWAERGATDREEGARIGGLWLVTVLLHLQSQSPRPDLFHRIAHVSQRPPRHKLTAYVNRLMAFLWTNRCQTLAVCAAGAPYV